MVKVVASIWARLARAGEGDGGDTRREWRYVVTSVRFAHQGIAVACIWCLINSVACIWKWAWRIAGVQAWRIGAIVRGHDGIAFLVTGVLDHGGSVNSGIIVCGGCNGQCNR